MLAELGLVEQRFKTVSEVLDGATVTTARRYGVARQTVHTLLRRYAVDGFGGLADQSSRPGSCPHQMPAEVEERVVEMRRVHPGWGLRTIGYHLGKEGVDPVPGRSSIYRALVRHGWIRFCLGVAALRTSSNRPLLPGPQLGQDRVGDLGDQLRGDLHPVDLLEVGLGITHRHPSRHQRITSSLNPERRR